MLFHLDETAFTQLKIASEFVYAYFCVQAFCDAIKKYEHHALNVWLY